MRYLDTASRQPNATLGTWLKENVTQEATALFVQSGFFESDVLGLIEAELTRLSSAGAVVIVIGSNGGATTRASVDDLVDVLDLPNTRAHVRVIRFSSGLFHPKTYVVERSDRSMAAYVGSANFTADGAARHVEAGIALDTRLGDEAATIAMIVNVTRAWLAKGAVDGVHQVECAADVAVLTGQGVLDVSQPHPAPTPPASGGNGTGGGAPSAQGLRRLFAIPSRRPRHGTPVGPPPSAKRLAASLATTGAAAPGETQLADYPDSVWFDPTARASPTNGAAGLMAAPFPKPCLIVKLNRQSIKNFWGTPGTSDVNLPLDILPYIRFGVGGVNLLPKVLFGYEARYVGDGGLALSDGSGETNITYVGVGPVPTRTHPDLRLLVPSGISELEPKITGAGAALPDEGDFMVLHLPTKMQPTVRFTFLDRGSSIFRAVDGFYKAEVSAGHGLGSTKSAVWAPDTFVPSWP